MKACACVGAHLASQGKLESLSAISRGDSLAACLQSIDRGDLSSNSLDGISRQLLGSLGNLPENDPVLRDMLASMASAPATLGEDSAGMSGSWPSVFFPLGSVTWQPTLTLAPSSTVGSLGNLPRMLPVLRGKAASCESAVSAWDGSGACTTAALHAPAAAWEEKCRAGLKDGAGSPAGGHGLACMDIGHTNGTWGSLGDMTTLGQRGGSLLTDLDPARVRAHFGHPATASLSLSLCLSLFLSRMAFLGGN